MIKATDDGMTRPRGESRLRVLRLPPPVAYGGGEQEGPAAARTTSERMAGILALG
jgi:hypothetical protein